jgi:hypothetical protein
VEHWQILKLLMVAGFWSAITQGEVCQMKNGLVSTKKAVLPSVTSIGTFLVVLFFLTAGGATKDGAFLLSEVELIRVGSIVAYLDIS